MIARYNNPSSRLGIIGKCFGKPKMILQDAKKLVNKQKFGMYEVPIHESKFAVDGIEIPALKPRPTSQYALTRTVLNNYSIAEAKKIIDAEDWENAESFLNPWGTDQVTLVHFAAFRGKLWILERIAALRAPIYATDEYNRCALHYAAGQGHVKVVKWLLEHSDTDGTMSSSQKTLPSPRSRRASNHSVKTPKELTNQKASTHPQLSLQDYYGRTPLHQAVEALHVRVVQVLVNAGADVNARDKQGIQPLLLAHCNVGNEPETKMRYEKIIDILAYAKALAPVVHPLTGRSALHYAVTLNSCRAIDRLLKCGTESDSHRKGKEATTPLHLAARFGYHGALRILLRDLDPSLIDIENEYGWSPLHLATALGSLDCARALVDKGGNLAHKNSEGNTVIDLLSMYKHDADIGTFFTKMLDARVCLVDKIENPADGLHNISLDFEVLAPQNQPQMAVVSALMEGLPRVEQIKILQHPLIKVYIWQKWLCVRYVFYSSAFIHLVFAFFLSLYAMHLVQNSPDPSILRKMLLCSACVPFCQNMLHLFIDPKRYYKQLENWLSLICTSVSVAIAIAGEFIPNVMLTPNWEHQNDQPSWILYCISVSILLAWIQIMMLAGRFPAWGFYALIFSTVLKNVLKVLFIGIWIIIGFTLSFSVLFHRNERFDNLFNAFVKTIVMMTGEYDYENLFGANENNFMTNNSHLDQDRGTLVPITARVIFLVFVLLTSIILMNLLIGLAVSDVQELVKEGQFSRLLKQAEFIADCEHMTSAKIFRCCLVPSYVTKILKSPIDRTKNLSWHWGNNQPIGISKKLWQSLFKLGSKSRELERTAASIRGHNGYVKLKSYDSEVDEPSHRASKSPYQPMSYQYLTIPEHVPSSANDQENVYDDPRPQRQSVSPLYDEVKYIWPEVTNRRDRESKSDEEEPVYINVPRKTSAATYWQTRWQTV